MEGLYYPYSANKGADQLRSYCEADLRLYFRICKKPVFSQRGSFISTYKLFFHRETCKFMYDYSFQNANSYQFVSSA